jgi:hypothetical protein
MYLIYVLLGIYREYWDILGTSIYIYATYRETPRGSGRSGDRPPSSCGSGSYGWRDQLPAPKP